MRVVVERFPCRIPLLPPEIEPVLAGVPAAYASALSAMAAAISSGSSDEAQLSGIRAAKAALVGINRVDAVLATDALISADLESPPVLSAVSGFAFELLRHGVMLFAEYAGDRGSAIGPSTWNMSVAGAMREPNPGKRAAAWRSLWDSVRNGEASCASDAELSFIGGCVADDDPVLAWLGGHEPGWKAEFQKAREGWPAFAWRKAALDMLARPVP